MSETAVVSPEWQPPKLNQDDDPQAIGLLVDVDVEAALQDPNTIFADPDHRQRPLFVPIKYDEEANQAFFEGATAYYFNWPGLNGAVATDKLIDGVKQLPVGAKVMIEYREDRPSPLDEFTKVAADAGRSLALDPDVIDKQAENMAGVHHFYSPLNREPGHQPTAQTMNEAYQELVNSGRWQRFADENLTYISGENIDQALLDKLWDAYDQTFDDLVSNHPSAQKQPREYFEDQVLSPQSKVVFAQDGDEIVSAIFLVEDATTCPWLNPDYFHGKNPDGKTIYVPGISTKLTNQGVKYSTKLVQAMATVVAETAPLTGFGTQCTNRSVIYIPDIAETNTVGIVNLKLEPTATYLYPVYDVA